MPKNLHGGKHKHLKKEVPTERKITFIEPSDDMMYAYVAKGYGNRNFDITILKNHKTVRICAQYRRRKKRIAVGDIIKVSVSNSFTEEFYAAEEVCCEHEVRMIENSEEYSMDLRKIRNQHDFTHREVDSAIEFDTDMIEATMDDDNNIAPQNKDMGMPPSDSDSEEYDLDDL